MSFKLDESTSASSNNELKARLVAELLADHIPEDEALLMKNGRYACLVCHNRPVCDTMAILSQHRRGKNHRYYLVKFMEKKEEQEQLILKRKQEIFLKTGNIIDPTTSQPTTALGQGSMGLLKNSSVYDSRTKTKSKPYGRKAVLCYGKSDVKEKQCSNSEGNAQNQVKKYIKESLKKRDFSEAVEEQRRLGCISDPSENISANFVKCDNSKLLSRLSDLSAKSVQCSAKDQKNTSEKEADMERSKYYFNLRASGWKKDLMGNWIRDEDAEFDSDEEPPNEFLPK